MAMSIIAVVSSGRKDPMTVCQNRERIVLQGMNSPEDGIGWTEAMSAFHTDMKNTMGIAKTQDIMEKYNKNEKIGTTA